MENAGKDSTISNEMISISRAEYDALLAQNAELTNQVKWLMEQMRLARHKEYGPSSEKSKYDHEDLFNEPEATADMRFPEPCVYDCLTTYFLLIQNSLPSCDTASNSVPSLISSISLLVTDTI